MMERCLSMILRVIGEVIEDDPECDPVRDSVIIDLLESISST